MNKKSLVPLCLVLVLGIATGACQWRETNAATINGRAITLVSLQEEVENLAETPTFATTYLGTSIDSQAGSTTAALEPLSNLLSLRIRDIVVTDELAARGIKLTADDLANTEDDLLASFAALASQSGDNGVQGEFASLAEPQRREIVRRQAADRRLREDLAGKALAGFPADARTYLEANKDNYSEVCLNGIVFGLDADTKAGEALAQLNSGRPFGDVAKEFDPDAAQTGGNLGCAAMVGLAPSIRVQLATAPINKVLGPLQTTTSTVLVSVYKRTDSPFEAVADDVTADWQEIRDKRILDAYLVLLSERQPKAQIDPRFGYLTPNLSLTMDKPVKP